MYTRIVLTATFQVSLANASCPLDTHVDKILLCFVWMLLFLSYNVLRLLIDRQWQMVIQVQLQSEVMCKYLLYFFIKCELFAVSFALVVVGVHRCCCTVSLYLNGKFLNQEPHFATQLVLPVVVGVTLFKKAGSVVSNRIKVKFARIVQVSVYQLTVSDF